MTESATLQDLRRDVRDLQVGQKELRDKLSEMDANVGLLVNLIQQGRGMAKILKWVVTVLGLIGLGTVGHKLLEGMQWLGRPGS